jgi:hypothetical protein
VTAGDGISSFFSEKARQEAWNRIRKKILRAEIERARDANETAESVT